MNIEQIVSHRGAQSFPSNTTYFNTLQKEQNDDLVQGHKRSITVNELIRTFHNINFERNSKRLFFMEGMFSAHFVYFEDELLLLIVGVWINSYYLLVSIIIA